jgi:hypothetical protein
MGRHSVLERRGSFECACERELEGGKEEERLGLEVWDLP